MVVMKYVFQGDTFVVNVQSQCKYDEILGWGWVGVLWLIAININGLDPFSIFGWGWKAGCWYSSNFGWNGWVKMCLSFYGGKHSEWLYLRCFNETDLKFWIKIKCEIVKSDLWNRYRLINFEPSAINNVELSIWTLKNREKKREFQYQTLENRE